MSSIEHVENYFSKYYIHFMHFQCYYLYLLTYHYKRGCLKNLRWPLLFHFRLKSFVFIQKEEFTSLFLKILSFQTVFCYHKPPKKLLLQDYMLLLAGQTQFQPS